MNVEERNFKKGDVVREVTVQTGGSVIIPCHYENKYIQHKKYWCYDAGTAYNCCCSLAYTNKTKGDVSVIDHPHQSLFTVTMRDLQEQNTGTYWCAVDNEGHLCMIEQLNITIQSDPDVSVMSSSVTVDEGGNISVQCLYTSTYKNKHKQWCRYKDKSCYTSQNASVEISEDGRGSLTVVIFGLMKSDSGWYYCSVGDQQAPVQLTVTGKTYSVIKMWKFCYTMQNSNTISDYRQQLNKRHKSHTGPPEKVQTLPIATPLLAVGKKTLLILNPECDVTYSFVITLPKTEAYSPEVEEPVIYSSVSE
nr:polymeric immunoglobulin receptor-like [Misgurnus anguillicaudatus]